MKNILIVDDHALFRQGLMKIIDSHFKDVVYGEASNSAEAIELNAKQKWDIVLLDINLPGRSGLDIIKELKESTPGLAILVLSMYPEDQFAVRVMKTGAAGYLIKDSTPEHLVEAINRLLDGRQFITPSVAELLVDKLRDGAKQTPYDLLTNREFQVFRLIAVGHSVTNIAKKLSLSVKTISTYRTHILEKLKLRNNADMIYFAIKNNLID